MQKKHTGILALFVLVFVMYSCGKKASELVIGKWKIEDVTAPQPGVPDSLRAYYQQQLDKQNEELLSTGYYEFIQDNQAFFELKGNRMEGKWRLSEDEKQIFIKEKNGTSETAFDIKELTGKVFIIESNQDNQIIRMVMKKSAE